MRFSRTLVVRTLFVVVSLSFVVVSGAPAQPSGSQGRVFVCDDLLTVQALRAITHRSVVASALNATNRGEGIVCQFRTDSKRLGPTQNNLLIAAYSRPSDIASAKKNYWAGKYGPLAGLGKQAKVIPLPGGGSDFVTIVSVGKFAVVITSSPMSFLSKKFSQPSKSQVMTIARTVYAHLTKLTA